MVCFPLEILGFSFNFRVKIITFLDSKPRNGL